MVPEAIPRNTSTPLNLFALIAIVGVLYFTRDVCIPFILAILLSFVLSPVVSRLQKSRLPRVPAVFLVVGLLLMILGMCGWLVGGQLVSLAEKLPQYQANVHQKLQSFQTSPGGPVDRLERSLESYSKEVESIGSESTTQGSAASAETDATAEAPQPVAVAIVKAQTSRAASIEGLMLDLLGPMISFGIVMILSLFILIRQEDVRDRAIRLLGGGQLQVATQALDDAGKRVSRFLLVQLIINASFGLCIAVGLFLIGVPYSLLWGLMAACLRFVPYFGAPIAAAAPLLMAFAATNGWTAVILTLVLFASLELSIANIVEPWLYGSSARISPLAIVASAIFWSWLWGPIGLLLSTPLTVCVVVIGRHIPRLEFLSMLLGDDPVLAPEARFYQRLLAADRAEAWEIAEEKLRDSSLEALYDTLIIPALILAEEDRHREVLDETREKYIFQSVRDLLYDLAERPKTAAAPSTELELPAAATERATIGAEPGDSAPKEIPKAGGAGRMPKVLCIPANDEADEMGAIMLSHLLGQRGMSVEVVSFKALSGERLEVVTERESALVCVSAVPPRALLHARYLCKRLRARHPSLRIVAGLWHEQEDPATIEEKLPAALADGVVTSLASAVARIASLASVVAYGSVPGLSPGEAVGSPVGAALERGSRIAASPPIAAGGVEVGA